MFLNLCLGIVLYYYGYTMPNSDEQKVQRLSEYFGISPSLFRQHGVLDAFIGVDTHLFLDPQLLRRNRLPEFQESRQKVEKYYSDILKLLLASKQKGDRAWREAQKRLVFKELHGAAIGYGVKSSDGNAIGPLLGNRLLKAANEILDMGIADPEIFELLGLFEEGFGADRLSDMTMAIIRTDLYTYSQHVADKVGIKERVRFVTSGISYRLPLHPSGQKPVIFLPKKLLRDLPVALSWDDIERVVSVNEELRQRLNAMIGKSWKRGMRFPKHVLRNLILGNPRNLKSLIEAYKANRSEAYDFERDPTGQLSWYETGQRWAGDYPLQLSLSLQPSIDEFEAIVTKIVAQFKKNIEENGLKECLYRKEDFESKPLHERYSQLLFYSVADTYCKANNVDLSREPNAGNGPVDFKISQGYEKRILVEIKLSSNTKLLQGFEKQLPAYERSEQTTRSIYVIIVVTKSEDQVKAVLERKEMAEREGKKVPHVVVINARLTPSASKL